MSAGRALEAALDALHGAVADALIVELRQHMDQLDLNPVREAEHQTALALWEALPEDARQDTRKHPRPSPPAPYAIPPQFLDKVLKFLAQNGINSPASAPRVDRLAHQLADLDLEAEARRPMQ